MDTNNNPHYYSNDSRIIRYPRLFQDEMLVGCVLRPIDNEVI